MWPSSTPTPPTTSRPARSGSRCTSTPTPRPCIRFIETSEAKIWKDDTCPANGSGRYAVFGTLVLGAHAYGVTELEGGGLEHIVKQLGYGDDPLNQRASVGWKGMRAAERLVEQYMVRIESLSSYSASAAAN